LLLLPGQSKVGQLAPFFVEKMLENNLTDLHPFALIYDYI